MPRYARFLSIAFLAVAASITLACGAASSQRQAQALTVSPASADAQDYPNGQVPFTATGTFSLPPTPVSPLQANWSAAAEQDGNYTPTTAVSINSKGVAQCTSGASGVYAIGAWVPKNPNPPTCEVIGVFGDPPCNSVLATAQLTCP
jgi:hypothetical protein